MNKMKVTPLSIKKKIDIAEFVNKETGECLISHLNEDTSITITEKTGLSELNSNNFAVIEAEAVIALSRILNNSDLANVFKMAITVKTAQNMLYNNNIPHSNATLQKYLQLKSEAMYMALIKRLMAVGVLYQLKGLINNEIRVCYILNPFVARRRKVVENKIIEIFTQFNIEK